MDFNLIKRMVKLVEESNINELSVEETETKIKIIKNQNFVNQYPQPQIQQLHKEVVALIPSANEPEDTPSRNLFEIKSPIVGTFYRSPSPDAAPFVKEGDTIKAGTHLCIIEAMKLMNEIESEVEGKIVKIMLENGAPVEYNQVLFLIEKF